jgi:hypothetical protein
VMIEKSAPSRWARFVSGLLDLNHTRIIDLASVLQIAKFVPSLPHNETNFAIRTLEGIVSSRWSAAFICRCPTPLLIGAVKQAAHVALVHDQEKAVAAQNHVRQ